MKTTKKDRDMLIAITLGDGWLSKHGHLEVWHSIHQKEYTLMKYEKIKKFCPSGILYRKNSLGKEQVGFRTKRLPFLKLLRRILYPEGKKVFSGRLLKRLGPEHLAILWMDDGSLTTLKNKKGVKSSSRYTLSLCTSREQCLLVADWIKSLTGVCPWIRSVRGGKYFSLCFTTGEGRIFSQVIRPFMCKSMMYKVSQD
ncbi:LAGLIDADG homing endonuclease [Salmonella phage PVPSE1]|uniref:LAGLIDADG homing endonuclease n=1 Tax=Salmonella phage PVPSE1 TaxID=889338 RepID=G3BLN2_9CAUD|nr:homing endonuclease with LAGLIDADG motif [Salmonella phage PVPSE1]ADP02412.1 LAGLIDADG homing endonuclease [Salmonella phage PVPSE1]